jgi:hypothetical protein
VLLALLGSASCCWTVHTSGFTPTTRGKRLQSHRDVQDRHRWLVRSTTHRPRRCSRSARGAVTQTCRRTDSSHHLPRQRQKGAIDSSDSQRHCADTRSDIRADYGATSDIGAGPPLPAPTTSQAPAMLYALPACYSFTEPPVARPTSAMILYCADGGTPLSTLTWTHWGPDGADGKGYFAPSNHANPIVRKAVWCSFRQ